MSPAVIRPTAWEWTAIAAILLCAIFLRWHHLAARSFWVDEIVTCQSIHGDGIRDQRAIPLDRIIDTPLLTQPQNAKPWWSTLRPDRDDIHPPFYFFLLRLWVGLFGWSEAGLRSFSATASVLALLLLYAVVRTLSGRGAALWAATIMAVAQPQIELSQEARSYTLLLAWQLAACLTLVRIEKSGLNRGRMISLALFSLALPFTHYFGVAAAIVLILYAAIRLRGSARRVALAVTLGALILFATAWFPVLVSQHHGASHAGTTFFVDDQPGNHLWRTLWRLALLPVKYLFTPLPDSRGLAAGFAAVCVAPWFMIRRRQDLLLWALLVPINIGPTLLVDLTHTTWSLELLRYTLLASPGVYALVASLTARLRSIPLRYALPVVAAAGCVLHLDQAYELYGPGRQDWRSFARDLNQITQPGDLGVFQTFLGPKAYPLEFLVCLRLYSEHFPRRVVVLTQPPSPELIREMQSYKGVLFVSDSLDPEKQLPGWRVDTPSVGIFDLGHATRLVPASSH